MVETCSRRHFVGLAAAGVLASCTKGGADEPLGPFIAPAELAARLAEVKAGRIAVFYVGPDALFARGHVPGAQKLPPIESEEGRRALTEAVAKLPANTEVVVYCGCCPVRSCPNVRPASAAVRAAPGGRARVLDLPTRFADDWADKGHPVERG